MSSHARGIQASSRKRKEREPSDGVKSLSRKPFVGQTDVTAGTTSSGTASSNRILAGYMAYEFLSKGTLLGQKFDPAVAVAVAVAGKLEPTTYAEVASLLKGDGAHIPGVVNPTQLARWIQM